MPNIVEVLTDIIIGEHVKEEDLAGFSEKERELLHECESVGRQRGFLCNFLKKPGDEGCTWESFQQEVETLAQNLLDICKLESNGLMLNVELVNMKNLILECMEEFHELGEHRNIHLVARIDSQPLKVYGDGCRLKQVLSILLNNAIKFSSEGSTIELLAKGLPQEIIISVIDHGIGIDLERQKNVFHRFIESSEQANEQKGTGIGLNLVKLLVRVHGGHVWVESTAKQGSNFSFCVPREILYHLVKERKVCSLF